MDYAVKPLRDHIVDLGKARIFYAVEGPLEDDVTPLHWDGSSPLYLKELGLTQGPMTLTANEEYSDLKLTEYTGPIPVKRYYTGEAPVLSVNMYLADPDLLAYISPTGTSGAGFESQQPVNLLTLVVFPEMVFRGAVGQPLQTVAFEGGAWLLNGSPIPESLDRFIAQTLWIWSASPSRTPRVYDQANGGEAVGEAEFTLVQDIYGQPFLPEGAQTYYIGDPATIGVDLEGGS